MKKRVAILGAGNGGVCLAFDFAQQFPNIEVVLWDFPQFSSTIAAIRAAHGQIDAVGKLEGVAVVHASHDLDATLLGAHLVCVVGPAYSTAPIARACKSCLKPGMVVLVCPSSGGGALCFARQAEISAESGVIVAETATLPYAVRGHGNSVTVYHKLPAGNFVSSLWDRQNTDKVMELVAGVVPLTPVDSIWTTCLQNGNPVIHPSVMLCNAARIDRGEPFLFYEQGISAGVGRLMQAVDTERRAIGATLGTKLQPLPELGILRGYQTEPNYDSSYREGPGFKGIPAPSTLDHRHLNEDIGYGLMFLSSLGAHIGVPTPVIDSVILMGGTIAGKAFRRVPPRTVDSLGLGNLTLAQLKAM